MEHLFDHWSLQEGNLSVKVGQNSYLCSDEGEERVKGENINEPWHKSEQNEFEENPSCQILVKTNKENKECSINRIWSREENLNLKF